MHQPSATFCLFFFLYNILLLALPQTSCPFMNNMMGEKLIRAFNPQRANTKKIKNVCKPQKGFTSIFLAFVTWLVCSVFKCLRTSKQINVPCNDTSESLSYYCTLHISDSIALRFSRTLGKVLLLRSLTGPFATGAWTGCSKLPTSPGAATLRICNSYPWLHPVLSVSH